MIREIEIIRERQIENAALKYIEENSINGYVRISDPKDVFIEGADWADNNPISPWISVKEELPCDEKDMVIEFIKDVELRTKKVVVLLEDGFIDITYMYNFLPHGWHWNINDVITHWFPIPEPPKE